MDNNANVIQKYIDEGRKPIANLKSQIVPISDEFLRLAEIRLGAKADAELIYGQAQQEWKKQLEYISEQKKFKN